MIAKRILPSLTALQYFEASVRHMSFTRAARELNVTQSAVSEGRIRFVVMTFSNRLLLNHRLSFRAKMDHNYHYRNEKDASSTGGFVCGGSPDHSNTAWIGRAGRPVPGPKEVA